MRTLDHETMSRAFDLAITHAADHPGCTMHRQGEGYLAEKLAWFAGATNTPPAGVARRPGLCWWNGAQYSLQGLARTAVGLTVDEAGYLFDNGRTAQEMSTAWQRLAEDLALVHNPDWMMRAAEHVWFTPNGTAICATHRRTVFLARPDGILTGDEDDRREAYDCSRLTAGNYEDLKYVHRTTLWS